MTHEQYLKLMDMVNIMIEHGWRVEFVGGKLVCAMNDERGCKNA